MRKTSNDKKSAGDPAAAHIEIRFYPYVTETQAAVVLARGVGSRSTRVRLWAGLLHCSRADLAGLRPPAVVKLLNCELHRALDRTDAAGLPDGADNSPVGAPAPLEGPQGEAWMQPELDFAN